MNNENPNSGQAVNVIQKYTGKEQSNVYGIISMVLGILSIVTICCVPYLPIVLGIISISLGIVQIIKGGKKGMAIAGIICSVVSIILYILIIILGMYALSSGFYDEILRNLER